MTEAQTFAAPVGYTTVPTIERPAPSVTWHAFDLKSGRRGPMLTTRTPGTFGQIIGEATDCQQSVRVYDPDLDDAGVPYQTTAGSIPGAVAGTEPGRSLLVALNEDERPIWGGMVLVRKDTPAEWVDVSCATLEHYLSRRYVGDLTFTNDDQAEIVAGIIDGLAVDGIGLTVDAPASARRRTRTYADDEDKTVLSVLQDLMGVENGPEFTVDLEWTDDTHTALSYVVRVRDRLGVAPPVPIEFSMPGSIDDFTFTEDYADGNGANDVLATSSGQGDSRPESDRVVQQDYLDGGWPRYEHRFQPSTSITRKATLNEHAAEELALMKDGLRELELTANLDTAPRYGSDWSLGDDVTVSLTCARFPAYVGPDGAMVPGFSARCRVVGWEANYVERTITPKVRLV